MHEHKTNEVFSHRLAVATELHLAGMKDQNLLSQLYCRFLPGSKEEGDRMARHVMKQIKAFDEARNRFLELDEQWARLGEHIVHLMDGFTMSSQCRKLRSINQAIDALHELCNGTHTLEEVVLPTQPGYRGNTGEKGRDTELRLVLENLFIPLGKNNRECDMDDFRQDWMDDTMLRSILTMALYTIVRQEENPLDFELPLEYVALEVCRLHSTLECQERKESTEQAERRRSVDSAVVKLFLTSGFLAGGTETVLFSGSSVGIYSAYYLAALAAERFLLV